MLREGRRGRARDFYIAGDLKVELGLMCTDETDIEELNEMYGPLCWQLYDKDPTGFKKLTRWKNEGVQLQGHIYMVKVCGRAKETAFAPKHLGRKKQEVTLQLDGIIGPGRRNDEVYIFNDVRTWATWDHYPKYSRIQEEEKTESFSKGERKTKWTG